MSKGLVGFADWLRMRAGRGLDECKTHGCGRGVMELPLPTEPFEWAEIADPIPVQPEEKKPFARPEEFQFLELPIPRVSPPEASPAPVRHLSSDQHTNYSVALGYCAFVLERAEDSQLWSCMGNSFGKVSDQSRVSEDVSSCRRLPRL